MAYKNIEVEEFINKTYSKDPAPGGGGVSSLCGSLGTALAGMVSNFTTGKKKYAEFEEDIKEIINKSKKLQNRFLDLIDEDEENFLPLSKAYGIKAETEEERKQKQEEISRCSIIACKAPLEIIDTAYEAIMIHKELVKKGSVLLISDVGVGIECLRSALKGGYLNMMINMGTITDKDFIDKNLNTYKNKVNDGIKLCDKIYEEVLNKLNIEGI